VQIYSIHDMNVLEMQKCIKTLRMSFCESRSIRFNCELLCFRFLKSRFDFPKTQEKTSRQNYVLKTSDTQNIPIPLQEVVDNVSHEERESSGDGYEFLERFA